MERKRPSMMRAALPFLAASAVSPHVSDLPSIDVLRKRTSRSPRYYSSTVPGDTYPDHHARMYRGEASPVGERWALDPTKRRNQKLARKARRRRKRIRGYFIG